MFKRLQLKMTITYTLILIAILSVTNLGIYYFVQRYNNVQMSSEISRMLESIEGSEWLYPPEDDDDDDESETITNPTETVEESDEVDDSEEVNETHEVDEVDETNKTDESEHEEEVEGEGDGEGGGSAPTTIETLIIPQTLNTFDYYMVFSSSNQLVFWKSSNATVFDQLIEKSKALKESEAPKVVELAGEKTLYFLLTKMPIEIDNASLGYYVVAREVTAAYETLDNLLRVLIVSLILGVFVSAGLGYFFAGRSLKPIREAYASKQEFLANASHELKTPLSVIMLSTETLEGEINPELAFQRQIVSDIKDETQKMNHLVSDLLYLARNDSRTATANFELFNLSETLEKEIVSYEKMAQSKGLALSSTITPNIKVLGDRKQLLSVITILVDNAMKYTKMGGQIFIELDKSNTSKNQGIKLNVKDTGIGIPEQELKRIFERFYRSETSRSKETGGYGLGLAIAKEIVEQHGGTIHAESIEKVGTTFSVEL